MVQIQFKKQQKKVLEKDEQREVNCLRKKRLCKDGHLLA